MNVAWASIATRPALPIPFFFRARPGWRGKPVTIWPRKACPASCGYSVRVETSAGCVVLIKFSGIKLDTVETERLK
jgi:hypothetical protein